MNFLVIQKIKEIMQLIIELNNNILYCYYYNIKLNNNILYCYYYNIKLNKIYINILFY